MCAHPWLQQLKGVQLSLRHFCRSPLRNCAGPITEHFTGSGDACYGYRKQKGEPKSPLIRTCPRSVHLGLFLDDTPSGCLVYILLGFVVYLWHFSFPWNKRKSLKIWKGHLLLLFPHRNPEPQEPKLSCQGNTVEKRWFKERASSVFEGFSFSINI